MGEESVRRRGPGGDDGASVPPEEFRPDALDADEGEPEVAAFAGDEQTLTPNAPKDGEHGYGYE